MAHSLAFAVPLPISNKTVLLACLLARRVNSTYQAHKMARRRSDNAILKYFTKYGHTVNKTSHLHSRGKGGNEEEEEDRFSSSPPSIIQSALIYILAGSFHASF